MQRAPIVLAATAAGLAGTLGFSAHSPATPGTTTAVTTTSSPPSTGSSSSSSSAAKTVTGSPVETRYGPVQLKVTVSGGKITSVQAVQLPSNDPKSTQISSYAEPQLQQSALSKQSANVDTVSGATYTSDGYKTALQATLDQAGFSATSNSA
jgi:uncharacterized protein with FMN-binding domain